MESEKKNLKRVFTGTVVSDKMEKTVVVKTTRTFTHPRFNKILQRSKKYKVHDESSEAKCGDVVEIIEGKPQSKEKYMYLLRVVKRQEV